MNEEWISWEAYKERHKDRFKKEKDDEKFESLQRWAHHLVWRVQHKHPGIHNALDGIKSAIKEIETYLNSEEFKNKKPNETP